MRTPPASMRPRGSARSLHVCAALSIAGGAVLTGGVTLLGACGGEDFASDDGPGSGASGTGGTGASGTGGSGAEGGGGTPVGCIPSENDMPVGDNCGVFVSSTNGDDANPGTKAKPKKSIGAALEAAASKPVYVCAESTPYAEEVAITEAVDLYGGLDCARGWAYDETKPTRIVPAAPGIPLRVKEVGGAVLVSDLDLNAADATAEGESSVGAFVDASPDVTMTRVRISAGKGMKGADAALVPFNTFPEQVALDGKPATAVNPGLDQGGVANPCDCPAGDQTTGGGGGDEQAGGQAGGNGAPDHGAGQGGTPSATCVDGVGKNGNPPATNGSSGAGASMLGALSASGWQPAAGQQGLPGPPGQGGGGGASGNTGIGAGGGGGCGGCGGAGGPGGAGGGASIALLVLDSAVRFEHGSLTAAALRALAVTGWVVKPASRSSGLVVCKRPEAAKAALARPARPADLAAVVRVASRRALSSTGPWHPCSSRPRSSRTQR